MLVSGVDAFSPLWCGYIFVLCYTHLKLALLHHKTATAKYILHSTVVYTLDTNTHLKVLPGFSTEKHFDPQREVIGTVEPDLNNFLKS